MDGWGLESFLDAEAGADVLDVVEFAVGDVPDDFVEGVCKVCLVGCAQGWVPWAVVPLEGVAGCPCLGCDRGDKEGSEQGR